MADKDLDDIRARRMAELQKQYGSAAGAQAQSPEAAAKEEERKMKEVEMRNSFLSQVLTQEARARLNTVATAKPEKAKMIENMLMNMTRMGQIQGKLSEEELKSLLEQLSEHTQKKTTVKFERRRNVMDDDDDDDF